MATSDFSSQKCGDFCAASVLVQEKPFIHFAGNSDIYLFILPQCQILAPKKTLNLMLYSNLKICTQVQKSNNEERTSFGIRFCMLITESIQQWTKRKSHSFSSKLFVIFVSSGNTHSKEPMLSIRYLCWVFPTQSPHPQDSAKNWFKVFNCQPLYCFSKTILNIAQKCPNLF